MEQLSRDEIIERVRRDLFSRRRHFFEILDGYAAREVSYPDGPRVEHFAWPDALTVITLEEWNTAYQESHRQPPSADEVRK